MVGRHRRFEPRWQVGSLEIAKVPRIHCLVEVGFRELGEIQLDTLLAEAGIIENVPAAGFILQEVDAVTIVMMSVRIAPKAVAAFGDRFGLADGSAVGEADSEPIRYATCSSR